MGSTILNTLIDIKKGWCHMTYLEAMQKKLQEATTEADKEFYQYQVDCERDHISIKDGAEDVY